MIINKDLLTGIKTVNVNAILVGVVLSELNRNTGTK